MRARYGTIWICLLLLAGPAFGQNTYYDHGSFPAPGSPATSAAMRAELDLIEAGFAKLPTLSISNANKAVVVNSSGTALTTTFGPIRTGTVLPLSPTVNDLFILTNSNVAGDCNPGAGNELSLCIWNGTSWDTLGSSTGAVTGWPTSLGTAAATSESAGQSISIRGQGGQATNGADLYQSSTGTFEFVCVVANVRNDCDYIRQLAVGKYWDIRNNAGNSIFRVNNSGEIQNLSLSAESSGNLITIKRYMWRPFAACNSAAASPIWDLPASNAPVAACKGTTTNKGVLEFPDGSTDLSTHLTEFLHEDWTGAIDATIVWESTSTSTNNVLWGIAIACAGAGDSSDPAYTDDDFTADANNATANTYNMTTANTVTTTGTCAAGKMMHVRVKRRLSQAGDTLAATAQAVGLSLKLREGQ